MERIVFHRQIYRIWFIRIVAILLFTIMHLPIKAEARLAPDSLYRQLETAEGKERVLVLQALVANLKIVDSVEAYRYFYDAIELAEDLNLNFDLKNSFESIRIKASPQRSVARYKKIIDELRGKKYPRQIGFAYSFIGREYLNLNNYDSSEYYQNKALSIFTKTNCEEGKALALDRMGQVFLIKNQFLDALKYYYQALQVNQLNGFERDAAGSLYHIGLAQLYLGNYHQAVDFIIKSLGYWEKVNNRPNTWNCNELIGNIYIQSGDFQRALQFQRIALAIRQKHIRIATEAGITNLRVNYLGIAYSYNNIAEVYLHTDQLDSAYYYALHSYQIKTDEGSVASVRDVANSELNLGDIYFALGNTDSAYHLVNAAAEKYKSLQNWSDYSMALYSLGKIELSLKKPLPARQHFFEGLEHARQVQSKQSILEGYKVLSKMYLENKDLEKAYDYYVKYAMIKDSIFNREKSDAIEEIQIRYEVDKKTAQIEDQELVIGQKQRHIKTAIIVGVIVTVLLVLLIVFIIKTKRQKEALLTKEAENLRQDLELKNRELVCNVSNIYTKNLVINKVAKSLQRSSANFKQSNMELVQEIISELRQNLDETSWHEFEYRFARVHESFYETLDAQFPDLAPAERKVCAMLKLNMSSKEIAAITMVRPESVDTARSRIRKKLGIDKDENLSAFLNRI